jgi:hypothetical protein
MITFGFCTLDFDLSPFYVHDISSVYSHHNHEGNVTSIPFAMRIRQGDLLGGSLFVLAHFKALHCMINHFLSCLFPSIANDTRIIGPHSILSFAYEHFQTKLHVIGLSIQP